MLKQNLKRDQLKGGLNILGSRPVLGSSRVSDGGGGLGRLLLMSRTRDRDKTLVLRSGKETDLPDGTLHSQKHPSARVTGPLRASFPRGVERLTGVDVLTPGSPGTKPPGTRFARSPDTDLPSPSVTDGPEEGRVLPPPLGVWSPEKDTHRRPGS